MQETMQESYTWHQNTRFESCSDDISETRAVDGDLLFVSSKMDHTLFHTSIASHDSTNESVQMHYEDDTVMIDN